MSSFYLVTVDSGKSEVIEDFLTALCRFVRAVDDGAEDVTLRWSS
jgi:hypothetical protein